MYISNLFVCLFVDKVDCSSFFALANLPISGSIKGHT